MAQMVAIKFLKKGEPGPVVEGAADAPDARISDVVILEAGMVSGRTSVALIIREALGDDEVGKVLACVQLSAAQFDQIAGAVRGGAARFGEVLG